MKDHGPLITLLRAIETDPRAETMFVPPGASVKVSMARVASDAADVLDDRVVRPYVASNGGQSASGSLPGPDAHLVARDHGGARMAEPTDYADLVTLLQERAKLYDSRGSASVMLEAASAISALVRERESARERVIALQRQLKHEPARIRKLALEIVHGETEAPGPMPCGVREALERSPEDCMRAAIRATKHNIAGKIAHADWRLPVLSSPGDAEDSA